MTMTLYRASLHAGISGLALLASAASAQGAPSPAITQLASADTTEDVEIVVFGQGQTRQVSEVSAVDIRRTTPGTSPLKVIQKLPGVNFQSADPFGVYEWSTRISLRGFNQNQLGFTLGPPTSLRASMPAPILRRGIARSWAIEPLAPMPR